MPAEALRIQKIKQKTGGGIMDMYMGTIVLFAGDFEPHGFLRCNGQQLNIAQWQALYSIIGNTFGGDNLTFSLPNLTAPDPGLAYYMCAEGRFPPRQ